MNGEKCVRHKKDGSRCKNYPIDGATVCRFHGGKAPQVKAKAAVRHEIESWGLGDVDVDLPQLILRMIWKSWQKQGEYEAERDRLIAESVTLRDALVGDAYGEGGKTGEYIRGFQRLLDEERDRGAGWAFKAAALGVHVKQIEELSKRLSEGQGAVIAEVLRAVLADPVLGLSAEQLAVAPAVFRAHLGLTGAPLVIEGGDR